MKKIYPYLVVVVVCAFALVAYSQAFSHFFFEDDFFHIVLSRGQTIAEAFNIFQPAARDYFIYRPLTTQLFWKVGESLFGLNPLPFNIINFVFYLVNIFLVFKLAKLITKSTILGTLAAIFYGLSGSHFYRLFFLSTFQDTVLATLFFLTSIFYLRKSNWAFLTFILALTAKETAVTIPGVLFLYDIFLQRRFQKKIIVFGVLSVVYFLLHKLFFGFYTGGIYAYDFHPVKVISNYWWYFLWSLGLPEPFVNVRLYKAYLLDPATLQMLGSVGVWNLALFTLIPISLIAAAVNWLRKKAHWTEVLVGGGIFVCLLLPVAFFPFHKFAINLAAALFGVSLVVAIFLRSMPKWYWGLYALLLTVFLAFTVNYNYGHHWTNRRGLIANKVISYLQMRYPQGLEGKTLYFRNDLSKACDEESLGQQSSSEIAFAMAYEDGFKVFYPNDNFFVFYQDLDNNAHCNSTVETIDSRQLLQEINWE